MIKIDIKKHMKIFATVVLLVTSWHTCFAEEITRTISVSGSAEKTLTPDRITIYLRVVTKDADFKKAKEENTKRADNLIKLAKKYGANDEQIQSENFNVRPEYQRCNLDSISKKKCDPNQITSYYLDRKYSITLNDFSLYDDFIISAMDSGIVNIDNIRFTNTKINETKETLQVRAALNAKKKAQAIVGPLNVKLGKPISISTEDYMPNDPIIYRNNIPRSFGKVAESASAIDMNTLGVGEIKVKSDIDITFEIE